MKKTAILLLFAVSTLSGFSQDVFRMGLQIGWFPGRLQSSFDELSNTQTSIYNFGLQCRIGGRLYGVAGLDCHVSQQTFSRADSSCDFKTDYLGFPLRVGFSMVDRKSFKWRIETGLEFRTALFVSPNDWNLNLKSQELNRNHMDFVAGTGADWGKFTADISYRHVFSTPLRHAAGGGDQLWISVGILLK